GIQKLHIQQRFPRVFDFLASTIQEESDEAKEIIKQKVDPIYEQGLEKMYDCIDYSKFRKDIDIEKAIEILNWTMFGFGEKGLKQINSFENLREFGEKYLKDWNRSEDITYELHYSF